MAGGAFIAMDGGYAVLVESVYSGSNQYIIDVGDDKIQPAIHCDKWLESLAGVP